MVLFSWMPSHWLRAGTPTPAQELDAQAQSIEWLVAEIERELAPPPKPELTPNQELIRSLKGVEPRWWIIIPSCTGIWLMLLYAFGWIADELVKHIWWRFCAMLVLFIVMVFLSREIGGRFRALNDRTKKSGEIAWGMTAGWLLIGLVGATSDPMKKLVAESGRYDTITSATLVSWIALIGAMLKLPWDRATELRKHAHVSWRASLQSLQNWLVGKVVVLTKQPVDPLLELTYQRQLADWDKKYDGWRPQWRVDRTLTIISEAESRHR
jgi:hypothetical protein